MHHMPIPSAPALSSARTPSGQAADWLGRLAAASTLVLLAACSPPSPALHTPAAAASAVPGPQDRARIEASIPADGADTSVPAAAAVFAAEAARSASAAAASAAASAAR
jgi:hypothetical protein